MRLFVGLTDRGWVERVRALRPGDANLWRPHRRAFRALEPGDPFLFRLHAPWNAIVGGGTFVEARRLPPALAWLAFGPANGVADPAEFEARLARARPDDAEPVVSAVVLARPFVLDEPDWIPSPAGWRPSVAHGKLYEGDEGRALWAALASRSAAAGAPSTLDGAAVGPGRFRLQVADAYGHRCAISGERALAALDVVHIRPPSQGGPNQVDNGLLLRADLGGLFRHGLLTVEPDGFRVRVGPRLRGGYAALEGRALRVVPERFDLQPSRAFLAWHGARIGRSGG